MTLQQFLHELDACEEAIKWSGKSQIKRAVKECPRGDWILWLAQKLNCPLQLLTLAKARCAATVKHLMTDSRSKKAVEVAEKFGLGEATREELNAAYADAYDAYNAADAAAYASYTAAYASTFTTADAAAYASYTAAADSAAAAAAYAVYTDAADAADAVNDVVNDAAKKENQLETANICREVLGDWVIKQVEIKLK